MTAPDRKKHSDAFVENQLLKVELLLDELKQDATLREKENDLFKEMLAGFDDLDPLMQEELTHLAKEVDAGFIEDIGFKISAPGRYELEIDDTGSEVYLTLTPPLGDGKLIAAPEIITALKAEGITAPLDQAAVEQAARQVAESGETVAKVLVARGAPAVHGQDGTVVFKAPPRTAEDGESEEAPPADVGANDLLATVAPPTPGQPGRNVFGEEIPARDGIPSQMTAGDHVRFDPATRSFYAEQAGRVVVAGEKIRIDQVQEIGGEVSLETGDLDFPGTVVIKGGVGEGRSVRAGKDVEVYGGVEAAKIEALAGSVTIHQGIQGHHRGLIIAGKDVTAKFVENAVIFARGNVNVQISAIGCEVTAGNEVNLLRSRGAIIGGVIRAGQAIKAKEIGSVTGTRTDLILGITPESLQKLIAFDNERMRLEAKLAEIRQTLERMAHLLGDLSAVSFEKKQYLIRLRKAQLIYQYRVRKLAAAKEQYLEEQQRKAVGRIEVHGTLHPGVRVSIGNCWMTIENPQRFIRLHYDQEKKRIVSGPLK